MSYIEDVGSPTPFQEAESFSYTPYIRGVVTAKGQFAECQSADLQCLVCASLPTEHIIGTLCLTLLSTDQKLKRLFTGVGNHWNHGDCSIVLKQVITKINNNINSH